MPSSHRPDIPGVIAPPPLIYIGFLLLGWAIFRFAATPEIVGPEMAGWLGLGFGMETQTRRIVSLPLIVGGLLLDGAAAGYFRRLGTAVEPWKPSTVLATAMDSLLVLLLLIPCLWVVDRFVIAREERYLSARFGADYDAYRARVRRWL